MWKFSIFVIALVVAALHTTAEEQKSCRALFSEQNRKQIRWTNDCIKQLGYKTGREKVQKSACVQKCILNNLKMLNADEYVDRQQYNTFLMSQWPEYFWDRANITFEPCLNLKHAEITGPDENCKRIEPITKCLTRNFSNLCKGIK